MGPVNRFLFGLFLFVWSFIGLGLFAGMITGALLVPKAVHSLQSASKDFSSSLEKLPQQFIDGQMNSDHQ